MENSRIYRFVFFFACLCLVFFSNEISAQNTKTKLSNEKKQLEKEIAEQKRLLETTKKNKTASLQDIQLITSQIRKQEQLIQVISDEILSLDNEIEENSKELGELRNKLSLLSEEYKKTVYIVYKYRNVVNKTGFILSAESLTQAVRRLNYLQQYSRLLNQQLATIRYTQEEIQRKDTLLRQNKAEKAQLFYAKNNEKQTLAKQQAEKNQIVAKLKKRESQLNNEIVKKVNRQKQVDAAIKKIIDDEIALRIKQENAAKKKKTTSTASTTSTAPASKSAVLKLTPEEANLASGFENNKGRLPWPVEKGSIIANFGTYTHPEVSSVMMTNNGINLLTEKNASVQAVFEGVVSGVIEVDGSKVLLIRHGSYITVYTNLSQVYVKKGDKIKTKQIVGKVRSDPSEPNSELHFEIRKDKDPLNPALWIKR
ncbi:MAG: peptidoglycan DD-metalloendopeptidase family protein [Bacteroidales bacterium]|nr:peptidoglycan DD-metalloendopeptidase family protein [Bacteroidales bacterium]